MIRRLALPALVLALAFTTDADQAQAQTDQAVAIGLTAGTPGIGAEAQFRLGPIFVLRGGIETLGYDFDQNYDDIDYAGRFDFDTVSGFIDLHPLANGLMISGGVYVGMRNITLAATPTGPVALGGQTFTPAQVGTLEGAIKLDRLSPFLGLGFDDTFTRRTRWGFRGIVGVAWSQEPEVALNATGGTLSNDATFRARLADEARSIQDDAKDRGLFPVLQMGLNYRF